MIIVCKTEYNDCIEASAKIDQINSMIDSLDDCGAISSGDYNHIINARDILYEVLLKMNDKAKSYIEEE